MLRILTSAFKRFGRDDRGSLTIEAVLILPLLMWWYAGSLVFYDAFQARSVDLKASYTISDLISRDMDGEITTNDIDGMGKFFAYLTSGHGIDPAIRITLVRCKQDCDQDNRLLKVIWSKGTDGKASLSSANIMAYNSRIPIVPNTDPVLMVETFTSYEPPFNAGLSAKNYENIVVTRPRFVAEPCLKGTNCVGD